MKHLFVFSQFTCIVYFIVLLNVFAFDYGLILQLGAIAFGVWAVKSVGDNNWSVYPTPNERSSITASGAYKFVRHPMYTAIIFFLLPVLIRTSHWINVIVYLILVITLVFKIRFEEKQLIKKHPEYEDFKKETSKRLIPFIW